jgi:predicted DNA-binding transcriptional regulator AlpA
MQAIEPLLLRPRDIYRLLNIEHSTFYRILSAGTFPTPIIVGKSKLWKRRDIERWVDNGGAIR